MRLSKTSACCLAAVVVLLAGCGPDQDRWSCNEVRERGEGCPDNTHITCPGGDRGDPVCACNSDHFWTGETCAPKDYEACCACLARAYRGSGQSTPDDRFDDRCISNESECVLALNVGSSIRSSTSCFRQYCAGSCAFLSFD